MIVKTWSNSRGSYGIKVTMQDRQQFFKKDWKTVVLEFEGSDVQAKVNIDKPSFWSPKCGELINREIKLWLQDNRLDSWPKDNPHELSLELLSSRRFLLRRAVPNQ